MSRYLSNLLAGAWRLLVEIDRFGNVILGGAVGETISSRVGRYLITSSRPWTRYLPEWFRRHAVDSIER